MIDHVIDNVIDNVVYHVYHLKPAQMFPPLTLTRDEVARAVPRVSKQTGVICSVGRPVFELADLTIYQSDRSRCAGLYVKVCDLPGCARLITVERSPDTYHFHFRPRAEKGETRLTIPALGVAGRRNSRDDLLLIPPGVRVQGEWKNAAGRIAMFFLARFGKKFGKNIRSIPRATIERLSNYSWPGNIRELQNVIERAAILSHSAVLELEPELIPELAPSGASNITQKSEDGLRDEDLAQAATATLEELERAHIVAVLNQTGGVVEGPRGAAKILGLHPNTLRHRIQKLGLKRTSYHPS